MDEGRIFINEIGEMVILVFGDQLKRTSPRSKTRVVYFMEEVIVQRFTRGVGDLMCGMGSMGAVDGLYLKRYAVSKCIWPLPLYATITGSAGCPL